MFLRAFILQQLLPYFQEFFPKAQAEEMIFMPASKKILCDFQINGFMTKANEKALAWAEKFVHSIEQAQLAWLDRAEVSGPGFVNLHLKTSWLMASVVAAPLKIDAAQPQRVLVDYSAPNVAKEMAVHHMRSTFLGDALVRVLEWQGDHVLRANHIGDWGAQFGHLLAWFECEKVDIHLLTLSELEKLYCLSRERQTSDPDFYQRAKQKLVALQQGEERATAVWRSLVQLTMDRNQATYQLLNVTLKPEDVFGESFYRDQAEEVLKDLLARGLAFSEGESILSWVKDKKNKEGEPLAVVWKTQEGTLLYSLSDLACVRYRAQHLQLNRIIYCVDSRQKLHFDSVWSIAREAGYVSEEVSLEHQAFGMMLGTDGQPYKTRSGETPKLLHFLEEAKHALDLKLASKFEACSPESRTQALHGMAVNAIKYADLCRHRASNYIFNWSSAFSFEGNSAFYLLYALVRAERLLEKAGLDPSSPQSTLIFDASDLTKIERDLWLQLLEWHDVLARVSSKGLPHLLCQYLYHCAVNLSAFYESAPVLTAPSDVKARRLALIQAWILRFKKGLDLLGFLPVPSM